MLKVIDLFAGGGGFHIGCEKAGFEIVAFCEKDKYASKLYFEYFGMGKETYFKDATTINTGKLPEFDVLCAGFPCQPFSTAGKRQGFKDTRGTLFFDVARILKDRKPKYFILENVKGLLNHDNGRTFSTIIKVLSDIGYQVEWQVLHNLEFGIPQNRERIFIVGILRGKYPGKIFPLGEPGKIYPQSQADCKKKHNIAQPLKARDYQSWEGNFVKVVGNVNPSGRGQNGNVYSADGISPTLTTNKGEGIKIQIYQCPRGKNEGGLKDIVPTISSSGYEHNNFLANGNIYRRLTPLECFRLQGFPDGIVHKAKEIGISDRQLYKIAGNSVCPLEVEEIALKIKEIENAR